MASWVLSIDAAHPQHWDYAQQAGFWDLRTKRNIEAGDLVYFWQSGKSFAGRVRATTDVYDLQPGMTPGPWDDWPGPYRARFEFEVMDAVPVGEPKWGEVQAQVSVKQGPNWAPRYTSAADEAAVAAYFGTAAPPPMPASPLEQAIEQALEENSEEDSDEPPTIDLDGLDDDQKKIVEAVQALREGQQQFRKNLLAAYGACAITGTTVTAALDAAHIRDYSGPKSNILPNGLVLRGDLHRLFDRHLLTITPDHVVHLSPQLADATYADLDGRSLRAVPASKAEHPHPALLAEHNEQCDWLHE